MKKKLLFIAFVFLFIISYTNVFATSNGSGSKCLQFEFNDGGFPASVVINHDVWNSQADEFHTNDGNYTIVILAGKKGNEFPELSTPGGFSDPENVTVDSRPNTAQDPLVEGDEYIYTITLTNYNTSDGCQFLGGVSLHAGAEPTMPTHDEDTTVTITISGEELEYHYVADKPDEADVTYFKFAINSMISEDLVPFTFGNANYTYIDGKEPPKNVSSVTTKQPINYRYRYDDSGYVEFCVNGGGTDEYTSIKINGVDYSQYAPHTKEDYWKSMGGWAQMFCIKNVPYSASYNVVVEGRDTADENKVPGFGWSYLTKERSTDISEEGNFAHGRLEFVSASLVIDGEEKTFASANTFNNYRYKGTGQIFQWGDGQKEYPEADRRLAWGEAQMPYGTTLRVRIVPDKGYQLTGLTVSENGFQATETPGEYELTLTRTNLSYNEDNNQFNLNPKFEKIDATASSDSKTVPNVVITINKGENAFGTGTPKLEVTDVASMSPERKDEFDKATTEGYEINNYLEMSLYNAIYKGGKKTGNKIDSWDTEIHSLQNKATIGLELEEDLGGNDVEVIHEVRDNDNKIVDYETIKAEYDRNKKTVTFETDGFSTYAIAVKKSDEPFTPDEKEKVKIDFDMRCPDCSMEPVEIAKGSKLSKPKDPTQEGFIFVGWFTDEDCKEEFDFNTPVEKDLVLYAQWSDKVQTYTVEDGKGNSITFNEIKDRKYELTMVDVLPMTDAELKGIGATREQYNEVKKLVTEATSKYGTLIAFYQIEIKDKDDGAVINEGPFEVKIKLTSEMKKYNEFKMVYINDEFKAEDIIELKVENGYLVGKLPHLSSYTLVGNYNANLPDIPKTGDNIYTWVILFIVSIIGISLSTRYITKASKARIK